MWSAPSLPKQGTFARAAERFGHFERLSRDPSKGGPELAAGTGLLEVSQTGIIPQFTWPQRGWQSTLPRALLET